MSATELLLSRLNRVRSTGPDTWDASCPGPLHQHGDRNPSLSVKAVDDRVLLRCHAGCGNDEIVTALGLSLADLYDKPLTHCGKPLSRFQRKRYGQARGALKALTHECRLVGVLAEQMAAGFALDPSERDRLKVAIRRVASAQEVAG